MSDAYFRVVPRLPFSFGQHVCTTIITFISTHARRSPWLRSLRGEGVRGPQGPLTILGIVATI